MIAYHLLNVVKIKQPRWHDHVILPRVDKFKLGGNIITIEHPSYASKYYCDLKTAETYPQETKKGIYGDYQVFVIPLDHLQTLQEHAAGKKTQNEDIINDVKELFGL